MWNYLRSLCIDDHRTFVQVVKEQLRAKFVTEEVKSTVNISFRRGAYVADIKTPTAQHVKSENEVEVPESENSYVYRVFAPTKVYGTERARFHTVMLQGGTKTRNGKTYRKYGLRKHYNFCR